MWLKHFFISLSALGIIVVLAALAVAGLYVAVLEFGGWGFVIWLVVLAVLGAAFDATVTPRIDL